MRIHRNSLLQRMMAVGLAASMVLTTPFSALAENVKEEGNNGQEISNYSLDDSVSIDTSETEEAKNIELENSEGRVQTYNIEPTETNIQTDSVTEEPSREEVQLSLELVAEESTDGQTPSLKLTEAANLSDKLNVNESNKLINVTDGDGLILLSNVDPSDYKDYTINLITAGVGWDVTKTAKVGNGIYSFLGLGNEGSPFEGEFKFDNSTDASKYSIATVKALFNALSTDATLEGKIPFYIADESYASTSKPLLAENLKVGKKKETLTCNIVLRDVSSSNISEATIGGLIGTMESGTSADISFENAFKNELKISGESNTGLFCNTMKSNASLTATFTSDLGAGQISVEATANGADAGGFVGKMEDGASVKIAGNSVNQVSSNSGNVGGIVGSAQNGWIQLNTQENTEQENTGISFTFADTLTLSAGNDKAAGGLIGEYTITKNLSKQAITYDLSKYKFNTITISGGTNVGGLFGVLESKQSSDNSSDNESAISSISILNESTDNSADNSASSNNINVNVSKTATVTKFGGLIGSYQAGNLASLLAIKGTKSSFINVISTGGSKASSSYGGVIGEVSDKSYVEIENVSVSTADMNRSAKTRFGGLVGTVNDGLLNVGSVTLTTTDSNDIAVNNVDGRGGLVGYLVKGVLRLHGKTDLSRQKITTAYNHVGQIVGNNSDGLVYATGNGNGLAEDGTGWSLTRYSGTDRSGSDIGNWGAVVRLSENLTESANEATGAFTFNSNAHTVTVNNTTNTNGITISNTNDFVAYALAFDISNKYVDGTSALRFKATVKPADKQSVTLTGNVDLIGTGVIGIGKDNTEKGEFAQTFTGTFDGGSNTVTLDIGTTYGANISENDNAAGQLYAKRSDQQDTHYSLALFPFAKDVTVKDLTIAGTVHCKIPKTVNQEETETDVRYPAFASGAIGYASGTATFEIVTVNAAVSVNEETSTDEKSAAKKLHTWQSGFLGRFEGTQLTYQDCVWGSSASLTEERSTDNARMGGLAAEVMGGANVKVKNCILSGTIISNAPSNARVGGLIAVSRGETQMNANNTAISSLSTINIANLQVNGENISAKTATATSGGLLGYQWQNTNVVFAPADSNENSTENNSESSTGVTISESSLTSSSNAQFGGLVYQATGYWNAAAKDSIVFSVGTDNKATILTGKSAKDTPSGLLVGTGLIKETVKENNIEKEVVKSALYLEVGTWGSASDAAYQIKSSAVTLAISGSEYFDELVGITKNSDFGNTNAVVSLAVRDSNGKAVRIDTDNTNNAVNTYTGQIQSNYKNGQTRYYYNLDSYRKNNSNLNLNSVSTAENLVLWSVAQYAAPNIRICFRKGERTDVTISGTIDLTGYSYYPITPIGAVNLGTGTENTRLTFAYEELETKEAQNKQPSDSDHQHYMMHYGLFYNTSHNIAVKKTSFSGTVGKEKITDDTENSNTYNSGVLIFGSVVGDPANNIVEISLNNVTLAGIRVTGVEKGNSTYAPLLINRMEQAAKLTVDTLTTGKGYTSGDESTKMTAYAATSLIGNVGNETATKLTLSFSNIALDGRVAADKANATSVYNNGNVPVEYHTTHTIFINATLLESFKYSSEGSGTYNFNSTDKMVTYGVELTNTVSTGRNPDKQYQYYDREIYITDEQLSKTADEAYVKDRYKDTKFIRYVHTQQNINVSKYELDINQKTSGLLEGCGTYGDPYIIQDAHQLSSLAAYIEKPDSVKKFQAVFNLKVLNEKKQTADSYHTAADSTADNTTTQDICYNWNGKTWEQDTQEGTTIETDTVTKYLLNAYYKINKDITLSAESFSGLGTKDNPFSGVIVGTNSTAVKIIGMNSNKDSFGGLIAYSCGSVVKDLKVDYTLATILMQADTLPGTTKNPFFGGVVGYCMGGDTIIDNVSVEYVKESVTFSGTYQYMIAAGGYVGLVGGATHVTEDSDYEKTGGGVVFRNMNDTTNNFKTTCPAAADGNKTVNMTDGKTTSEGGSYFYRNPYVGRVLDGYACAENCTVDNTDKNYTIPNLQVRTTDLTVSEDSGELDVTVTSAQGLWLLSAIVNSGAGAMDSTGSYTDVPNNKKEAQVVDAYQYGKPRTASYDGIGEAVTDADVKLADEKYWGGNASTAGEDAKDRVSYLVKNYTTGTTAARLAGKSSSADTNNPVNLTFNAGTDNSIDMTTYGNGFRGIGCSYGDNKKVWKEDCSIPKVYHRNLLVNSINADNTTRITITLNINQNDYKNEYDNGSWINQGAGLFVDFHFTNGCEVKNLQISGNVQLGLFEVKKENKLESTLTYVKKRDDEKQIGVGGFAARTANSNGAVTFSGFALSNIYVYGGTMTGGAIGYIDGYKNFPRNVTFKNWSINSGIIARWINNTDCTGGLVGWYNGYDILKIVGNEIKSDKTNVNDFSVMTIANAKNQASSGGIVGASDYGSVQFENIIVEKMIVTGENLRSLGGLIGEGRQGNKFSLKNCTLKNITVKSNLNSENIGGVIGYHDKETVIEEVTITEKSFVYGQQYVGGFVGNSSTTANGTLKIIKCKETDTNIQAEWNWVGGFVGYLSANRTAMFQECQESSVNILGRYVGGLIGAVDGNITASNVEFNTVKVITKANNGGRNAGLLTGNTANLNKFNNKVSGYNILAKDCKVGYSNVGFEQLATAKIEQLNTTGLWIGSNGEGTTTNLIAVSASGDVSPQTDIGTQNNITKPTIIYADKTAEQAYKPTESTAKPSSSANPWLDVNPKSDVPFADGTVMTGNGVGTGTANTILSELKKETLPADYYWNLEDNKDELVKFLESANDAYLTTYRAEESATTEVDDQYDFPILVVNNSAEVDTMLWNYIAAMTNVSTGTAAKALVKDITATTYKWNTAATNFEAQPSASLNISATKKITIVPNAYDNMSSQFTLLDVTYTNPTDDKAEAFHLYIPVLVKKVLYIWFKTRFIAGTDYCALDYPMDDTGITNHYATADFGEPLTAYIEYTYEKETDWQAMLDNGENLLWYYDKTLDLASGSTATGTETLLPSGTRLTLVDKQTKQYYTYETTGKEDLHNFNLGQMTAPDGTTSFAPVYICDLLELTVSDPVTNPKDGETYYVKTDEQNATVRVGTEYYRKAEDSDANAEKYRITIAQSTESGTSEMETSKARIEGYYLTVQIPKTDGVSIVNNRLNYAPLSRKEGTLPASIKTETTSNGASTSSSGYIVYTGVEQTLSVSTTRIHNGSSMNGDPIMENGDSIKITLESKLTLTETGREQFSKVGPAEVYHQFDINLKKYLSDNKGEYDVIGTEDVKYQYTLSGNGLNQTMSGTFQSAASQETLMLEYGGTDLKKALESAVTNETAITVTAEITLTYAVNEYFPKRDTSNNNDNSGVSAVAVSRIANTKSQLPITENKKTQEDSVRYYTANPSKAVLTYSTVMTSVGDTTQQLGINPSDEINNVSELIDTRADYDYSNVDANTLENATQIRYTMELFQKNASGTYDEINPLVIGEYLQDISKDNIAFTASGNGSGNSYQWIEGFSTVDAKHEFARFQFAPLTGEAFEEKGYMYANYKVRLTVVLLDASGNELDGTKASDYIIYTNARIYQQILDSYTDGTSDNIGN